MNDPYAANPFMTVKLPNDGLMKEDSDKKKKGLLGRLVGGKDRRNDPSIRYSPPPFVTPVGDEPVNPPGDFGEPSFGGGGSSNDPYATNPFQTVKIAPGLQDDGAEKPKKYFFGFGKGKKKDQEMSYEPPPFVSTNYQGGMGFDNDSHYDSDDSDTGMRMKPIADEKIYDVLSPAGGQKKKNGAPNMPPRKRGPPEGTKRRLDIVKGQKSPAKGPNVNTKKQYPDSFQPLSPQDKNKREKKQQSPNRGKNKSHNHKHHHHKIGHKNGPKSKLPEDKRATPGESLQKLEDMVKSIQHSLKDPKMTNEKKKELKFALRKLLDKKASLQVMATNELLGEIAELKVAQYQ